jgi:hypothetical protein
MSWLAAVATLATASTRNVDFSPTNHDGIVPFLLAHDLVRPRWRKTSQQGNVIVSPLPGTTASKPWFFCLAEKCLLSQQQQWGGAHSIEMMML